MVRLNLRFSYASLLDIVEKIWYGEMKARILGKSTFRKEIGSFKI